MLFTNRRRDERNHRLWSCGEYRDKGVKAGSGLRAVVTKAMQKELASAFLSVCKTEGHLFRQLPFPVFLGGKSSLKAFHL